MKLKKVTIKKIIDLGTPSAMQMFFEVALFTGAIWLCGILGTTSQAANQIALSLASFNIYVCDGIKCYSNDSSGKSKRITRL